MSPHAYSRTGDIARLGRKKTENKKTQFLLLQLGKEDANNCQFSDCQGCLF